MNAPKLSPFWLSLFGLAALGAGTYGLIDGTVQVPSTLLISSHLERATDPAAYWALTVVYLAAGILLLALAWQQQAAPAEVRSEPPRRPSPRWARALAWVGLASGGLLLAAAVMFHFALGPIVSLMFVAIFGGGGLVIGLASVGYLVTGRLE